MESSGLKTDQKSPAVGPNPELYQVTAVTMLSPISWAAFFDTYWGHTHLFASGQSERFQCLGGWELLNNLLANNSLGRKLSIRNQGRTVPSEIYIGSSADERPRPRDLSAQLRDGAVLTIDDIHHLHPPVGRLCSEVQGFVSVPVTASVSATTRLSPGLDVRCADQDTFLLQLHGPKRLRLYGPAAGVPDSAAPAVPSGPPLWETTLHPGDLVYYPRGWWYQVIPLDEPCLQLRLGYTNVTGLDLVRWVAMESELARNALLCSDIPRLGSDEEKVAYCDKVSRIMSSCLSDANLLDAFWCSYNARAPLRVDHGLPWSGTPEILPPLDIAVIRMLHTGELILVPYGASEIAVWAGGNHCIIPSDAVDVLEQLSDRKEMSVQTILANVGDFKRRGQVLKVLTDLIISGIAAPATE